MKVFFGGVPTEPDIKKIREVFPDTKLEEGDRIPYRKISDVISEEYNTSRWRTVTMQWRKKVEKDTGIIIGADGDERAFYVMSNPEKVGLMRQKLRSASRFARRTYTISAVVDVTKINEEDRKMHEFCQSRSAKIIATAQLRSGQKQLPEM